MMGHHLSPCWAIYITLATTRADFSNVAPMLKDIAKVEDVDINVIGKFHRPSEKRVLLTCSNLMFFSEFTNSIHFRPLKKSHNMRFLPLSMT